MKYLFDTDHISFLQRRSGSEYAWKGQAWGK